LKNCKLAAKLGTLWAGIFEEELALGHFDLIFPSQASACQQVFGDFESEKMLKADCIPKPRYPVPEFIDAITILSKHQSSNQLQTHRARPPEGGRT